MTQVLVLCGGLSPERDVSLRSGRRVAEALKDVGVDVEVRDVDASLLPDLVADPPQCVVPMLHGASGEDGSLADVLTTVRVPFIGSGPAASRASFDKSIAKAIVATWGIATPDYVALPHAMFRELGAGQLLKYVRDRLSLPLVVKPARGGSALGVSIVTQADELPGAMVAAFAYGDVAVVERFISGVEVAVSVIEIEGQATPLPAVEIVPDDGIYDYESRYTAGTTEFFCPARLSEGQQKLAADLALAVHKKFGFRDYSRTDMIISEDTAWFLETNVAPGMTETSLMPQSIAAAGLSVGSVFAGFVARAQ